MNFTFQVVYFKFYSSKLFKFGLLSIVALNMNYILNGENSFQIVRASFRIWKHLSVTGDLFSPRPNTSGMHRILPPSIEFDKF